MLRFSHRRVAVRRRTNRSLSTCQAPHASDRPAPATRSPTATPADRAASERLADARRPARRPLGDGGAGRIPACAIAQLGQIGAINTEDRAPGAALSRWTPPLDLFNGEPPGNPDEGRPIGNCSRPTRIDGAPPSMDT